MHIDCDAHIMPLDQFDYVEGDLRKLCPLHTYDADGYLTGLTFPGAPAQVAGTTPLTGPGSGSRYKGLSHWPERMEDYRKMGVDMQLLFPQFSSLRWSYLIDPALATAMAHSYNLSVLKVMREYPAEMFGGALVALQDASRAIAEIEWAKQQGFKGVLLDKVYPVTDHCYSDALGAHRELWPFFKRAEELEMPILLHTIQHGHRLSNLMAFQTDGLDLFAPQEGHVSLVSLITSGLLDEFPRLQFVYTEAGTGWIKPLAEKLDAAYEHAPVDYDAEEATARFHRRVVPGAERSTAGKRRTPLQVFEPKNKRVPSDYFRKNFFFTIETEEPEFADAVDYLGASQFLFATDYPHDDPGGRMKWKDVELLEKNPRFSERDKELMRSGNAVNLLRL
jgi:predicted TIM-barrel fold metal-dependent hydrolase